MLFSVPSFQTFLGTKVTNYLNKEYDVDITINRVGLTYFWDVNLKEVFIKDHHQDTLIYAGGIETSILNLREISNGKPKLGDVLIGDLTFNMKTYKEEKSDNLMTFIRKFNSDKKKILQAHLSLLQVLLILKMENLNLLMKI